MVEFRFKVYCNRWSSDVTYRVKNTPDGWHISHKAINGDCDPGGKPYFYMNFDQDYINYPEQLGEFLTHLWSKVDKDEIDDETAQTMLQELADWVSACEHGMPKWKGYNI